MPISASRLRVPTQDHGLRIIEATSLLGLAYDLDSAGTDYPFAALLELKPPCRLKSNRVSDSAHPSMKGAEASADADSSLQQTHLWIPSFNKFR